MRILITSLMLITLLAGCGTTGSGNNSGLQPSATTNRVALTNLNLGIEYMRTGSMERALEKLNRAYEADPRYFGIHNAYGLLYQRLGKPQQAETHFKRAIELNSNDSNSKNNYGSFLCQQNRYAEAEDIFLSAAENPLYDTPEIAYANAGTCASMNERDDLAEQYFRRALSLNPEVPSALLQMAQLSYDQGNVLSARGYLQRYQAIARHTPVSLLLGIRIERELGDKNAVSSYEMLLRNNYPDSIQIQQLRELPQP